ncbi:MAG: Crp/Fnr family transcriptional regulator [Sedimenticola sp.]
MNHHYDNNARCSSCDIRKIALYRGLSDEVISKLEKCRRGIKRVAKGEILFLEDSKRPLCYTVRSGIFLKTSVDSDGTERSSSICLASDFIGFQSGANEPMTHTISALTECYVCCFHRQTLYDEMVSEQPGLLVEVLNKARKDHAYCENKHHIRPSTVRVAFIIYSIHMRVQELLAHRPHDEIFSDGYIPVPLHALAKLAEIAPEHLSNEVIPELVSKGIIRFSAKKDEKFKILDPSALLEMVSKHL